MNGVLEYWSIGVLEGSAEVRLPVWPIAPALHHSITPLFCLPTTPARHHSTHPSGSC
jgi:hypothetical protein